jgi:hypothetical protein
MSKTTTRTAGQKRKHEDISAASPGASSSAVPPNMAGMGMNGAQRPWEQPARQCFTWAKSDRRLIAIR